MVQSDTFSGFFYQLFVISPAISWILRPGRFPKRKAFMYAILFLVLMASIPIGLQLSEQEDNYYKLLGITRDASFADIKRAYRSRSVDIHPDKNPSALAAEEFSRLRIAFDVLSDTHKRPIYDIFGPFAIEKETSALQIESIISLISFYVMWGIITFVMTQNEMDRDARAWSFVGIGLFFCLELNLKFASLQIPNKLFPYTTIFEIVSFLRSAFPPFMNGCRTIGGYFYRSVAHDNFQIGIELLKGTRYLYLSIQQLQADIASNARKSIKTNEKTSTTIPSATETAPPGIRKRNPKFAKHSDAPTITETIMADQTGNTQTSINENNYQPEPKVQRQPELGIPRFVYAIGFYILINYFLR